ncbi:MAG: hemerythrin domain-containing protein [Planctomycetota bacterium]|jgi:hemerythrin-like domain-containing protein
MRSIELLRREHVLIEKVVASLDRAADFAREGERVDEELFLRALDFTNGFTHRVHRAKEEVLSRLAAGRGLLEAESRPCSDLLDFSGAMLRALPEAARGEPTARRLLSENAKAYVALMRSHFRGREALFDVAERSLAEEDDRTLVTLFERVERQLGQGQVERYRRLADEVHERSESFARRV